MLPNREFAMTERDFKHIAEIVYDTCGIVLPPHKQQMVYSRIAPRIRSLGLKDCKSYVDFVQNNKTCEFSNFINAITTNLTSFLRESHHFDFLENVIVKDINNWHAQDRRVRIWSAGCSTGEEPYSIAMTIAKQFKPPFWDLKILATDLDSNVLNTGRNGIYARQHITGLNEQLTQTWFKRDKSGDYYKVNHDLRSLIHFKRLNLLADWPMKGPFDVIFCRNVVIYFDQKTKDQLFHRYYKMLRPAGYLILGHSETMSLTLQKQFKSLGKTIYRKIE